MNTETNQRSSLEALESHIDLFEPLGGKLGILRPLTPATSDEKEMRAVESETAKDELGISITANEDMNSVISALLDVGVEELPGNKFMIAEDENSFTSMSSDEFERIVRQI